MGTAVLGAGFAGLALTWYLASSQQKVTVFDPLGIGHGASGVSAGVLHPFPGKQGKLSWRADAAMEETFSLLQIAEEALGRKVSVEGVFRPALSNTQVSDFKNAIETSSWGFWKEKEICGIGSVEGMWIPQGKTIFSRLYLEGLWQACAKKGARFIQKEVIDLEALYNYDRILIATGGDTLRLCPQLPLNRVWGQVLLCYTENPVPFAFVSQGYVAPTEDPKLCHVGSTYEHTENPDRAKAYQLLEQVSSFYPQVLNMRVVEVGAGVRITPRNTYHPLVQSIDAKTFVFTGLGSRGLLYHALCAKELINNLITQDHGGG